MAVNWAAVLNRCSPTVRKTVMDVRTRHEELRRLIGEARSTRLTVNFASFREQLPVSLHSLIDTQQARCAAIVPLEQVTAQAMEVKQASQLQALEQERKVKLIASEAFIKDLQSQITQLEARLAKLKAAKPVAELTVDDVYEMRPEWREQFHQALKADCWASDPKALAELQKEQQQPPHH